MPDHKNVTDSDQVELFKRLLSLLNRIFDSRKIYLQKDKCGFLYELSKDQPGKQRLMKEMTKRYIFIPQNQKRETLLTKQYAVRIANVLYEHRADLKLLGAEEELLNELRTSFGRYNSEELGGEKTIYEFKDMTNALLGKMQGLRSFVDKTFLTYERIGEENVKFADWGIGVGTLKFAQAHDFIKAELTYLSPGDNVTKSFVGIATYKSDSLFIDLILESETPRRANIVIRITDTGAHDNSLLLGYFIHHSNRYNRLITKSLIIQAVDPSKSHNIGNHNFDSDEYKEIPEEIQSYLYDRSKNRLSQPQGVISSLKDLKAFLLQHKVNHAHRLFRNKHFDGKFELYFKQANGNIVTTEMNINFNALSGSAEGEFIYTPTQKGKLKKKWVGKVTVHGKNEVIVMELSNEKNIKEEEEEDPVLISFSIPKENFELSEVECFQGLICGLGDGNHGSVAYRCLITKATNVQPNADRLNVIFKDEIPLAIGTGEQPKFTLADFHFS